MKQSFNPQSSLHLGVIRFRQSETPIGVNAFGLTWEDAPYCLEADGSKKMAAFGKAVFSALKDGRTEGTFAGERWAYVGEQSCLFV